MDHRYCYGKYIPRVTWALLMRVSVCSVKNGRCYRTYLLGIMVCKQLYGSAAIWLLDGKKGWSLNGWKVSRLKGVEDPLMVFEGFAHWHDTVGSDWHSARGGSYVAPWLHSQWKASPWREGRLTRAARGTHRGSPGPREGQRRHNEQNKCIHYTWEVSAWKQHFDTIMIRLLCRIVKVRSLLWYLLYALILFELVRKIP